MHLVIILTAALGAAASLASAAGGPPPLDPGSVKWTRVEMTASKFLVSMNATLQIEALDLPALESGLLTPAGEWERLHAAAPLALTYRTEGLGRKNEGAVLLDGQSGRTFQRNALRIGGSPKYRIYRFEEDRVLRVTWRPDAGDDMDRPEQWNLRTEESYAYPPPGGRQVVAAASALIYAAAASGLSRPGDRLQILTLASDEFHHAELVVREPVEVRTDYLLMDGSGRERRTGRTRAIRVAVLARPVGSGTDEDFELLGLRDLEVLLDPETRAPLELRGRVDFFGRVAFSLDTLLLAGNTGSRAPD